MRTTDLMRQRVLSWLARELAAKLDSIHSFTQEQHCAQLEKLDAIQGYEIERVLDQVHACSN